MCMCCQLLANVIALCSPDSIPILKLNDLVPSTQPQTSLYHKRDQGCSLERNNLIFIETKVTELFIIFVLKISV